MICPRCKQALPDGAKFCTNCGADLTDAAAAPTRRIRIYGYKEWYAISPDVEVFLNGVKVGTLAAKGELTVEIGNENAFFEFHMNQGLGIVRKCHCFVNQIFNGGLQLKTNRWTGSISVEYTM